MLVRGGRRGRTRRRGCWRLERVAEAATLRVALDLRQQLHVGIRTVKSTMDATALSSHSTTLTSLRLESMSATAPLRRQSTPPARKVLLRRSFRFSRRARSACRGSTTPRARTQTHTSRPPLHPTALPRASYPPTSLTRPSRTRRPSRSRTPRGARPSVPCVRRRARSASSGRGTRRTVLAPMQTPERARSAEEKVQWRARSGRNATRAGSGT